MATPNHVPQSAPVVRSTRNSSRYRPAGEQSPGGDPGQSADHHGAEPGLIARAAVETRTPEAVFLAPELQNLGPAEPLPGAPGSAQGDGPGLPLGQVQGLSQYFSTEVACRPAQQKPSAVGFRLVRTEPGGNGDAQPEAEGRGPYAEFDAATALGTHSVQC